MQHQKFAVVDLETTGNDRNRDSIIQVGIVIVENLKIVDQYTTFLSDEVMLSPFIQDLTGIDSGMLEGAPKFKQVAKHISNMLEGCVFTAHNVEFDYGFLEMAFKSCGISFRPLYLLDTVELSKIFLPTLERFQLNEIAQVLDLELSNAHRADEDARATGELLIHLLTKITALDTETLKLLYHLSKPLKFNLSDLIFSVAAESTASKTTHLERYGTFHIRKVTTKPASVAPMSVDEIYGAYIRWSHKDFRADQLHLAKEIFEAMERSENLAVEAYTGIGKTIAFLIAAVSYHSLYGKQVLISTSKKILQNQIIKDELASLQAALGKDIPTASLKGKDNYIDLDAVELLLSAEDDNTEIIQLKMKLLVWLLETETGDIAEIHLRGPEKSYYRTASIQSGTLGEIFFNRALKRAEESTLIVTNHYFLTDCAEYLQDLEVLVIDEAHQLKRALDERLKVSYGYQDMKFFIGQIGTTNQDRLLSTYLEQNVAADAEMLEDILKRINHNIDNIFSAISAGNRTQLMAHLETGSRHASTFLGIVRDTGDYQAIYNHMHHYAMVLKQIYEGLQNERFSLDVDVNFQKIKIHIQLDDMETIKERVVRDSASILLSGTLEVNGGFSHLDYWFGEHEPRTKVFANDSLFNSTKLFIPEDVPDYNINDDAFISSIVEYMAVYLSETDQKLMILFSNYELLDKVYEYMEAIETFESFVILRQTKGMASDKLLSQFNQLERSILLGTSSFNEGINIEGDGLKSLMLTKLPFPVPKQPDFRHFYKNDLPEAVFQFRQIAGRIHRKPSDKGLLFLFDKRLLSRRYKNAFLKYFPDENVIEGNTESFKALLRDL